VDGTGPHSETALPVPGRPTAPRIRKTGPASKPYRLICPAQGCGRLGDYPSRRAASNAFGEHCDAVHPVLSPLDLVRRAVPLHEDGEGRWTARLLSGRRYSVRRTDEGSFQIDADGRTVAVVTPLTSLLRAQLCIAQLAGIARGPQAEAARIQLLREERRSGRAAEQRLGALGFA
jgi:hypothetical protein